MKEFRPFEFQGVHELQGLDGRVDTMYIEELGHGRIGVRQVTYVKDAESGGQRECRKLLRSGTPNQRSELEDYLKRMIGLLARHWEVVYRETNRDAERAERSGSSDSY